MGKRYSGLVMVISPFEASGRLGIAASTIFTTNLRVNYFISPIEAFMAKCLGSTEFHDEISAFSMS